MRQLILYIGVVVGITALIISCSSDDDAAKSSATSAAITPANCTDDESVTTAAIGAHRWTNTATPGIELGSFGSDQDNASTLSESQLGGIYSFANPQDNTTWTNGCATDLNVISGFGWTYNDVLSIKHQFFVTGNDSYSVTTRAFSDAACSNMVGFFSQSYDNVTVGDNVSFRSGVYDSSRHWEKHVGWPDNATRFSNTPSRLCAYATTDNQTTMWNSWLQSSPHRVTKGALFDNDTGGSVDTGWRYNYNVLTVVTLEDAKLGRGWDRTKKWLVIGEDNDTGYPDNYTGGDIPANNMVATSGGHKPPSIYYQDNSSN